MNGYARVDVDLAGQGLARTDVEFMVDEGPEAGFVSAGIEPDAANGVARIVVGAGVQPRRVPSLEAGNSRQMEAR